MSHLYFDVQESILNTLSFSLTDFFDTSDKLQSNIELH